MNKNGPQSPNNNPIEEITELLVQYAQTQDLPRIL